MGKVIKKKIQGMNWLMKTGLVLLLTLATSVFMYEGLYRPHVVHAAPTISGVWTNVADTATAGPVTSSAYTAGAGTNRLLLVAVSAEIGTGNTTITTETVTYGGVTVNPIATSGAISGRQHTWLGYILQANIPAGSNTVSATVTPAANAVTGIRIDIATYTGVNQTTPVNASVTAAPASATIAFPSALAYLADSITVIATANGGAPSALAAITAVGGSAFASEITTSSAAGFGGFVFDSATNAASGSYTTGTTWTFTGTTSTRSSMVAASLNPAPVAAGGTLAVSTATQTVAEAVGNATVSVTRSGGTTGAVTVDYITADGTALAGQDYTFTTGTLSWAAGDATAKTITIPIINDTLDENTETFTVTLSNATNGAALGTAVQTISITDDDAIPSIALSAATSSGSRTVTPAVFTVNLSTASGLATSVNYATANGTATAGVDYTATSGTLNIPALSTSGTINVPINAASAGGTFTVTLSTPVNSTLGATTVNTFTITAVASAISRCDGCHGYSAAIGAGATFTDAPTTRGTPTGKFQGSHNAHVIGETIVCSTCHIAPATEGSGDFGHSRGTITMQPSINGGTYSRVSPITVTNSFNPGSCSGTSCHAQVYAVTAGNSPNWGSPGGGCAACHNSSGPTDGTFQGNGAPATGGHNLHMAVPLTVCGNCHIGAVSGSTGGALHGNGFINVSTGYTSNNPSRNKVSKRTGGGTYFTCNNASCHSNPYSQANATTGIWGTGTGGCVACHNASTSPFISYSASVNGNLGNPLQSGPNTGSHSGHMNYGKYVCAECHAGALTGSTGGNKHGNGFINVTGANGAYVSGGIAKHAIGTYSATGCAKACHMGVAGTANPIWGSVVLGCIDCHAAAITRTKGRPGKVLAAITPEFSQTWGHKSTVVNGTRAARLALISQDCIVCHLEGNGTSHVTSNFHADGNIDLRDPDGLGETKITNISGGAFTFQRFSTSFAAGSRTSTGHTNDADIAQVISIKFCLACHDSNGTTNPTARTTLGTQYMPWGGTQVANYTVANGAAAAGGLVNVKFQVWSSNSSKHPVMAPLNKDFPAQSRMNSPYNNFTRTGTTGGQAAWSKGVVINCFDCHNTTNRGLTLRTVAAHGNATGLAGTYFVASPTLCTGCHGTAYATTGAQHGAGSALTTGKSNMSATTFATCHNCHMSNTALPARPVAAFDIHGFNGLLATGGAWTYGNGNGIRPISFLRNTVRFTTVSPRPKQVTRARIGILASGTATCGGNAPTGCGNNMSQYSPGGTY